MSCFDKIILNVDLQATGLKKLQNYNYYTFSGCIKTESCANDSNTEVNHFSDFSFPHWKLKICAKTNSF